MASISDKKQAAAIKSAVVGGVWRSRRTLAALVIATAMVFGFLGGGFSDASASIGWCKNCAITGSVSVGSAAGITSSIGWCKNCATTASANASVSTGITASIGWCKNCATTGSTSVAAAAGILSSIGWCKNCLVPDAIGAK